LLSSAKRIVFMSFSSARPSSAPHRATRSVCKRRAKRALSCSPCRKPWVGRKMTRAEDLLQPPEQAHRTVRLSTDRQKTDTGPRPSSEGDVAASVVRRATGRGDVQALCWWRAGRIAAAWHERWDAAIPAGARRGSGFLWHAARLPRAAGVRPSPAVARGRACRRRTLGTGGRGSATADRRCLPLAAGRFRSGLQRRGQVRGLDGVPPGEDQDALQQMLQFPDVPRQA